MTVEKITSRSNALCTHVRRLAASRNYREETGEFLCDSPKLLEEAVKWGAELSAVILSEGMTPPELPAAVRVASVPPDVMRSISPMETPQGVLFTCRLPRPELPEKLSGRHYVVLDGVQDPGNVGTVLRTADAFEADGLFLLPGCADLYNPKTLRASMGAVWRCPVWRCSLDELHALLQANALPLYGAALRDDTMDVRDLPKRPLAVAIGSEGRGLSEKTLSLCEATVRIPMNERCESLNAAAAAAVLLWELYR